MVVINPEELENTQLAKVVLVKDPNYKEQQVAVTSVTPAIPTTPTTSSSGNRTFTVNGVSFEMVAVKGGTFTMGCTSEQGGECYDSESPTHNVTLSDYYLGKYEVTVAQFREFINETKYRIDAEKDGSSYIINGSLWESKNGVNWKCDASGRIRSTTEDNHPVIHVSWNDAKAYCEWLSKKTGQSFRLPTEAEWEYAARGGNKNRGYKYSGSNDIDKVAWYLDKKTRPVGTKSPNELGIYDMSGNVWEWCQDLYGKYSSDSQTNPKGPSLGMERVVRGGSCSGSAESCRVSLRNYGLQNKKNGCYGFRLALSASSVAEKSTSTTSSARSSVAGVFSVSPTKKIQFSKGNLQYQASTKTWRFADNQWDIIGKDNKNISPSYNGWIDLFGWGTGNNPTKNSSNSSDYGSFSDWGNNTISNGGGKKWFTLTNKEWVYVFNTRSTNSGIRYAIAIVNGVNGVILLPDNWSSSNYSLSNTNKSDASFSSNRISLSDWTSKLEANGAVFLPAAGYRSGTDVLSVGSYGYCWSATYGGGDIAYSVYFYDSSLGADGWRRRWNGQSVRLVCLAE